MKSIGTMIIDLSLPWCTYRTTHPTGLFYEGKGQTAKVEAGTYKGSGIRFSLALTMPCYVYGTWTTQILGTFETEEEAYVAEENLVTLESLADPMRLNMHAGGEKSKYKTHGALLRKIQKERRLKTLQERKERRTIREKKAREKVLELKRKLKEKK
jgi:hypothetical protein